MAVVIQINGVGSRKQKKISFQHHISQCKFRNCHNDLPFTHEMISYSSLHIYRSLNACNWTATTHFRCIFFSFVSPCSVHKRDLLKIGMVLSILIRWDKGISLISFFLHSFQFFSEITIFVVFFQTAFVCVNTCIVVRLHRIASNRIEKALWILQSIVHIMFGSQDSFCFLSILLLLYMWLPIRSSNVYSFSFLLYFGSFWPFLMPFCEFLIDHFFHFLSSFIIPFLNMRLFILNSFLAQTHTHTCKRIISVAAAYLVIFVYFGAWNKRIVNK